MTSGFIYTPLVCLPGHVADILWGTDGGKFIHECLCVVAMTVVCSVNMYKSVVLPGLAKPSVWNFRIQGNVSIFIPCLLFWAQFSFTIAHSSFLQDDISPPMTVLNFPSRCTSLLFVWIRLMMTYVTNSAAVPSPPTQTHCSDVNMFFAAWCLSFLPWTLCRHSLSELISD